MDYSTISDEELMARINGSANTENQAKPDEVDTQPDYSSVSNEELMARINSSSNVANNTPQSNEEKQTSLTDNLKKSTKSVAKGTAGWWKKNIRPVHFLADVGKATANGFRDESIMGANAVTGAKNWALDKVGLSDWHKPTEDVKREREEMIPKFELNTDAKVSNFIGDMIGWAPSFAVGGEGVAAAKGGVTATKTGIQALLRGKKFSRMAKILDRQSRIAKAAAKPNPIAKWVNDALNQANNAGLDMAAFEGLRNRLKYLGGDELENSLGEDLGNGYLMGGALGGAIGIGGKALSPIVKAGLNTSVGKKLTSFFKDKYDKYKKLEGLNDIVSNTNDLPSSVETYMDKAGEFSRAEDRAMYKKLKYGDENPEILDEIAGNEPNYKILEDVKNRASEQEYVPPEPIYMTPEKYMEQVEYLRQNGLDDAQIAEFMDAMGAKIQEPNIKPNTQQAYESIQEEIKRINELRNTNNVNVDFDSIASLYKRALNKLTSKGLKEIEARSILADRGILDPEREGFVVWTQEQYNAFINDQVNSGIPKEAADQSLIDLGILIEGKPTTREGIYGDVGNKILDDEYAKAVKEGATHENPSEMVNKDLPDTVDAKPNTPISETSPQDITNVPREQPIQNNQVAQEQEDLFKFLDEIQNTNKQLEHVGHDLNMPKQDLGINTPKGDLTHVNEPSVSSNEIKSKVDKIKEPQNQYQPEEYNSYKVTKLEPGKAEGAGTSYKDLDMVTSETKKIKESDALDSGLSIDDTPLTSKFESTDGAFNDWYSRYEKAGENKRRAMLDMKFKNFKTQEEAQSFYGNFVNQADRDINFTRRNVNRGIAEPEPNGYFTSITEKDIKNVFSRLSRTNKLPKARKSGKVKEKETITNNAQDFGREVLKAMGNVRTKGLEDVIKNNPEQLSAYYLKNIKGEKGNVVNRAHKKIQLEYENLFSKSDSEKWVKSIYEQKLNQIENSGASSEAKALVKDALNKAYNSKLKRIITNKTNVKNNIKHDLDFQLAKNKEIEHYQTKAGRIKAAVEAFLDQTKDLKANKTEGDTSAIAKALQAAVDVQTGTHYLKNNKISNYFNNELHNMLKQVRVIVSNNMGNSKGKALHRYSTILIRKGENAINEFLHEAQHIVDSLRDLEIDKLPENNMVVIARKFLREKYDEAANNIINLKPKCDKCIENLDDKQTITILNNIISRDNLDKFSIEKFENVVNNIFGKDNKEAKLFLDYVKNTEVYLKDPVEIRARNAENGIINNETLDEAYINAYNKLKGIKNESGYRYREGSSSKTLERNSGTARNNFEDVSQSVRATTNKQKNSGNSKTSKTKNITFNSNGVPNNSKAVEDILDKKATPVEMSDNYKDVYKNIESMSKQGESIATNLRWITPEQAENRIKMQGGKNGALYFKQGSKGLTTGLDITKNPLESRSNKEGLSGKKTLKGLSQRGTTKDIIYNTAKETYKRQHIADRMKYIESNYAKPLGDKVPEGEAKINKYAFSYAQYMGYGNEFLDVIMKGDKAIDANFGHIGNGDFAKGLKELREYWTKDGEYHYTIPKSIKNFVLDEHGETFAEYRERYIKGNPAENGGIKGSKLKANLKLLGALNDFALERFKRGVLTSSSFFLNNRIGNQMMIAANADNAVDYLRSFIKAGKLKDNQIPIQLRESIVNDAVNGSASYKIDTGIPWLDTFTNLCRGNYIDLKSTMKRTIELAPKSNHYVKLDGQTVPKGSTVHESATGKTGLSAALNTTVAFPNRVFNKISDALANVNQACETFERKQAAYIKSKKVLKEHADLIPQTARQAASLPKMMELIKDNPELELSLVKSVEDMLGNYRSFNKYEKNIMKRIIPFYSWYRTMFRHETRLFKQNPTRWGLIHYELQQLKNDNRDRKSYQQDAFNTGLKDNGSNVVIGKGGQIPYNTYPEVFENVLGEGSPVGGLNPYMYQPIEALRGRKFFLNEEIKDKKYNRGSHYDTKNKTMVEDNEIFDTKNNKYIGKSLPISVRLNYLRKNSIDPLVYPAVKSPLMSPEYWLSGMENMAKGNGWKTADKYFDTSYSGYRKGDKYKTAPDKYEERYAANDLSEGYKIANRTLGTTFQKERPLSKKDLQERKQKEAEWRKKHKDKKRK